ncbi:MAG: JAB domain-containing protein [Chloroflexi bacterium]|nr:JAB domain-containing protein [Chloroflexota bacterium]
MSEHAYTPTIKDMPKGERPRERLQHYGAQALSTAELLAIILRTGVGGENVIRLAERLLSHFNGLPGIAQASFDELCQVKGIGPAKVTQIKAALELGRRLLVSAPEEKPVIHSPDIAANLIASEMALLPQEEFWVLLLDVRNRLRHIQRLYRGSLTQARVRVGEVFREAIRGNAAAIIVAHNHPSGDPTPSPQDVHLTRLLVEAGRLLDIPLLDHLIIGHGRWVSLKERGLGFPPEKGTSARGPV